jgi:hypothetical protein
MIGKSELLEAIAGKNRGLLATEIDRKAILAAIATLEDRNPTPNPIEAMDLLDGDWRLLYTTSQGLLGFERIPLLRLGQIYQCLRVPEARVYNIAELVGIPFLEGVISVEARFVPATQRRVNVFFERSVIGLQRIVGYTDVQGWINQLEAGAKVAAIDLSLDPNRPPGWLEITYLDQDLRIGRGNEGNVFVLTKVRA